MKALLLLALVLVVCVVLFFSGIISPRRSRTMQTKVERAAGKAEGRSRTRGDSLGRATGDAIEKSRKAAQASGEKGRELNDRLDRG